LNHADQHAFSGAYRIHGHESFDDDVGVFVDPPYNQQPVPFQPFVFDG
jgi:hypothetical protein